MWEDSGLTRKDLVGERMVPEAASDVEYSENEFHVRGYCLRELSDLLNECFENVAIYGQSRKSHLDVAVTAHYRTHNLLNKVDFLKLRRLVRKLLQRQTRHRVSQTINRLGSGLRLEDIPCRMQDFDISSEDLDYCGTFIAICDRQQ